MEGDAQAEGWLEGFAVNWLDDVNDGRPIPAENRIAVYKFVTDLTKLYQGDPDGPFPNGPSETLDVKWCRAITDWLGFGTASTVQALYDREQKGKKVHKPTIRKVINRINRAGGCEDATDESLRPGTPKETVPGYETPDWAVCPITQNMMVEPVVTPAGHHYERSAISNWLDKEDTDPLTRSPLNRADLIIDTDLARVITDWKDEREAARRRIDRESDSETQRLMELVAATETRMNKSKEALNKVKSLKKRRAKLLAELQTIDEELIIQTQIVEGCMGKVPGSFQEGCQGPPGNGCDMPNGECVC